MDGILLDSNFWFGLLDRNDQWYEKSLNIYNNLNKKIERVYLVLPWPTLYEFLNTRIVNRGVNHFFEILTRFKHQKYPDEDMRENAFKSLSKNKSFSLVDIVLIEIASKRIPNLKYFITYDNDLKAHFLRQGLLEFPHEAK